MAPASILDRAIRSYAARQERKLILVGGRAAGVYYLREPELAPEFASTIFAAWWAVRLLNAEQQREFFTAYQSICEAYAKQRNTCHFRPWVSYNADKRTLLLEWMTYADAA